MIKLCAVLLVITICFSACSFGASSRKIDDARYTKTRSFPTSFHFFKLPVLKLGSVNDKEFKLSIPEEPSGGTYAILFFMFSESEERTDRPMSIRPCLQFRDTVAIEILSDNMILEMRPPRETDLSMPLGANPDSSELRKRTICSQFLGWYHIRKGHYVIKIKNKNKRAWMSSPAIEYYLELAHLTGTK